MALPILLAGQALAFASGRPPRPSMVVQGVAATIRALKNMRVKDAKLIDVSLLQMGNIILHKSNYYVPKDTLDLWSSGSVSVTGKGFGARLEIKYDTPYAAAVHEILTNYHRPPTCAKYLERAVRETRGTCTKVLKRQFEVTRTL